MLLDDLEHGKRVGVAVQEACRLFGADAFEAEAFSEAPDFLVAPIPARAGMAHNLSRSRIAGHGGPDSCFFSLGQGSRRDRPSGRVILRVQQPPHIGLLNLLFRRTLRYFQWHGAPGEYLFQLRPGGFHFLELGLRRLIARVAVRVVLACQLTEILPRLVFRRIPPHPPNVLIHSIPHTSPAPPISIIVAISRNNRVPFRGALSCLSRPYRGSAPTLRQRPIP